MTTRQIRWPIRILLAAVVVWLMAAVSQATQAAVTAVGLTTFGEAIDALAIDPDGRLVISVTGRARVPCTSGTAGCPAAGTLTALDEDLLAFDPASGHTGDNSQGTWSLYLDGSDVPGMRREDVGGASIGTDGTLYLSIYNAFNIGGQKGNRADILSVRPDGAGYQVQKVWNGKSAGLNGALDAIEILP